MYLFKYINKGFPPDECLGKNSLKQNDTKLSEV